MDKHESINPRPSHEATLAARFWAKVERLTSDECWAWNGCRDRAGYGKMREGRAHRISYELNVGPIPAGLTIDHLCGNKWCVNPAHLEAVTAGENVRRWHAKRTHCNQGHPWSENVYQPRSGRRRCRICARAKSARGNAQQRRKRMEAS